MDAILQFLIDWGYWGLFLGSFIAGSVLPFSSEAVLAACVGPLGLDPVISIAAATAGNVSGGMTCYWMGHLGNMEWIEKYFHVKKEKMDRAVEAAGNEPVFSLLPFHTKKAGIVTTGSEVQKGLIKDTFTPVLKEKLFEYNVQVIGQTLPGDDRQTITSDILHFIEEGADLILCSGGMSVDPDDRTPGAIKDTGADIVTYGAPVLPGAMLLLAYYHKDGKTIPVIGLPGCVMYARRTVFDLILPRIMADDPVCAEEICAYGEGGLCLNCDVCTFPACGFGK